MALTTLPTAAFASGSVGTAQLADGAVTTEKLVADVNFRNLIINGDMSIAQRTTSSATISSSGYFTVDRFLMNIDSTFNSIGTMQQNLDSLTPPGNFTNYVGIQIDTGTALSGSPYYNFRQQIEGNNIAYLKLGTSSAQKITVSFWVRSTKTGDFSFSLRNGSTDRSYVTTYNIASANTWEKKTITISGDTTGTWTTNNAVGLTVNFGLGNSLGSFSTSTLDSWISGSYTGSQSATDLVTTTGAKWYITGIQLEADTSASDFEFLPYDVNLNRCERYYQKSYDLQDSPTTVTSTGLIEVSGFSDTSSNLLFSIQYKERMRATPTVTFYNSGGTSGQWAYGRNGASGNATITSYSGRTASNNLSAYVGIGANWVGAWVEGHYTLDAEL